MGIASGDFGAEEIEIVNPQSYLINEIFYSVQGEGVQSGVPMVFIRFSKCNMQCAIEPGEKSPGGFDCDTEFESGTRMTLDEIGEAIEETFTDVPKKPCWLLLTGGEPGLQADEQFVEYFRARDWQIAIETNGSVALKGYYDWICVSPKVAEHAIKQMTADEVKYVRGYGQGIPEPKCKAIFKVISPAFNGFEVDPAALRWCVKLVLVNPSWRLSVQSHKDWNVR